MFDNLHNTVACIPAPATRADNVKSAKEMNAESKRFATTFGKNGAKRLELIVYRLKAALVTGDIQPILFLADSLGGTAGARVRAIAAWAFGDALESKKGKDGKFTYKFSAKSRDAANNWTSATIASLDDMVTAKVSFLGDIVGAAIAPGMAEKTAPEFAREKYLATVLKRLNDNGESAALFANDLIRMANATKALAA